MISFVFAQIQLVPDVGPLLLHIAMILIMIWILNRTFFRPINKIIDERERKTGRGSGGASEILGQVDAKLSTYEKALREARSEGYVAAEADRNEALAARQAQITAVKDEVSVLIAQEKDSVQKQAESARAALTDDAKTMAETISATILKNT